jgi:hypothetical protein
MREKGKLLRFWLRHLLPEYVFFFFCLSIFFSKICSYQLTTDSLSVLFLSLPLDLSFSFALSLSLLQTSTSSRVYEIVRRQAKRVNKQWKFFPLRLNWTRASKIVRVGESIFAPFFSITTTIYRLYTLCTSISKNALKHRERVIRKNVHYLSVSLLRPRLVIIVDITVRKSSLIKKHVATCVLIGTMCLFDCCINSNERTYVSLSFYSFFLKHLTDKKKRKSIFFEINLSK